MPSSTRPTCVALQPHQKRLSLPVIVAGLSLLGRFDLFPGALLTRQQKEAVRYSLEVVAVIIFHTSSLSAVGSIFVILCTCIIRGQCPSVTGTDLGFLLYSYFVANARLLKV